MYKGVGNFCGEDVQRDQFVQMLLVVIPDLLALSEWISGSAHLSATEESRPYFMNHHGFRG
jgi:hypothetical protein